jgi:hypothetical protein
MNLEEVKNRGLEMPLPHFFDANADSAVAEESAV